MMRLRRNISARSPDIVPGFTANWRKSIRFTPAATKARVEVWLALVPWLMKEDLDCRTSADGDTSKLEGTTTKISSDSSLAGKALLRTALSHAVGNAIRPREWRIGLTAHGKPIVAEGLPQINFSVAHTDLIAAVAVSKELPVGIDVEAVENVPTPTLLELVCSHSEQMHLAAERVDQNSRDFIRLWTLKEAYSKMMGLGHSIDFAALDFAKGFRASLHDGTKNSNCFESIWVSANRKFSHVSIAVGISSPAIGSVDLRMMTMARAQDGLDATIIAPHLDL
jgi:phosphopantetheinyl transferase